MCINTVYRVENKGTKYNSLLTYAVVSLCFGSKITHLSTIPQQVRIFVQSYKSLSEYCELALNKSQQIVISESSHTESFGPPRDLRSSKAPERESGLLLLGTLTRAIIATTKLHFLLFTETLLEKYHSHFI